MVDPDASEPLSSPPYTMWHPMLVALLERFLPEGYELFSEYPLSRLPQRADILVVRRTDVPGTPEKLHSILDYLAEHTLIEFKGPTDDLAGEDVLTLLGYGYQYMQLAKLKKPEDVCLMVVADRITGSFLAQAERCHVELAEAGSGIWRGRFGGFTIHGVETSRASRGATEHLLYTLSRTFLKQPASWPLDPEEMRVYIWLYQQVEQFKQARGAMAVKDVDEFEKSAQEAMRLMLAKLPVEERLKGIDPEQRVKGITPEELVKALSPEALEELKRLLH